MNGPEYARKYATKKKQIILLKSKFLFYLEIIAFILASV